MSLPVWRVDISPFACNLLYSVAVLPFSSKHYTLPIIAFSFVLIYWKCLAENAPKVETFFGEACPHIFLVCSTSLRRSSLSFRAYTFKTSRYAPVFDIEKIYITYEVSTILSRKREKSRFPVKQKVFDAKK